MRFSSVIIAIVAWFSFPGSALGSKRSVNGDEKFSIKDEDKQLIEDSYESRLVEVKRSLHDRSKGGDERESIRELLQELITDIVGDWKKGGSKKSGKSEKGKSCKRGKSAKNKGEKDGSESSDKFYEVIEKVLDLLQYMKCRKEEREVNNPEEGLLELVEMQEELLEIFVTTSGGEARLLDNNEIFDSPFCPEKFDDGEFDGNERGQNQYGWGADFNADASCGIGVVVHSAGTPGLLTQTPSVPTVTLRDDTGVIIFKGVLNTEELGVRSALVVDCVETIVTVVIATIGFGDSPGFFKIIDIDTSAYNINDTIPPTVLTPTSETELPSQSVRTMKVLDGDTKNCKILFAPLIERFFITGVTPVLRIFNWCNLNSALLEIEILDEEGNALEGHLVWDFECQDNDICWVNLFTTVEDTSKAGGFAIVPKLFFFQETDVDRNADTRIQAKQVDPEFKVDSSAFSLLPISDKSVLVCTLSGFVYQIVASGAGGDLLTRGRHLQNDFLSGVDSLLSSVELGEPQECRICTAPDTGSAEVRRRRTKKTEDCAEIEITDQRSTNAYIWSLIKCGDYCFAGSLDLSSLVGRILLEAVFNIFGSGDLLDSLLVESPGIMQFASAVLVSLLYDDIVSPNDFGFDLWYKRCDDLDSSKSAKSAKSAKSSKSSNKGFLPVTLNGFRELADLIDPVAGSTVSRLGWPYPFDPASEVDDGIRNMVCHTDPVTKDSKLVVASAVYYSEQSSNTYVLDVGKECESA